jgi:glycosyltransferase involved in cell wall biosynthesis
MSHISQDINISRRLHHHLLNHDSWNESTLSTKIQPKVLVCIPAYNEAKNISDVVSRSKKYADDIIVYDDGSSDDTYELAKTAGAIVIKSSKNTGYGAAIRALFQAAREQNADIMVTLDSDGQHNPDHIPRLLEPIRTQNFDIVIGSRFLNKEDKEKVPKYRSFGIKTITKLTQSASYGGLSDSQSGFRAYNRRALSKINLFEDGMAVSTEILLRARENNLSATEVPITINYEVHDASTHNPVSHGIGVLYSLLQFISLRHPLAFYGIPGIVLLGVAAVFLKNALQLFSNTGYVSTNMILISIGIAVVGVILLATAAIVYTLVALLKDKIKY